MSAILIEFLYFEDCPFYKKAEEVLDQVLLEADLRTNVVKKNIATSDMARAEKFVGSPSIRVNGLDIDPAGRNSTTYARMCRVYWIKGGFLGWPTKEMLLAAINEAGERGEPAKRDG